MGPENKPKLLCTRYVHRFHWECPLIVQWLLAVSVWCPNLFRPGEIARIEDNLTGGKHKSAGKIGMFKLTLRSQRHTENKLRLLCTRYVRRFSLGMFAHSAKGVW